PKFSASFKTFKADKALKKVRIPHSVCELPFNYVDEKDYEMVSGYRKTFKYERTFDKKRVFLNFDGAAHISTVYFNNKELGTHLCGYTGFKYEISSLLKDENKIVVRLDSNESVNVPPFGGSIDYLTYGGIYRDVYLTTVPETFIADVYAKAVKRDDSWYLNIDVKTDGPDKEGFLEASLYDRDERLVLNSREPLKNNFEYKVSDPYLWSVDKPYLYRLVLKYGADTYETSVGFRTAEFREDGFYLNDEKLKLRGLNRHQAYPYVGYAMPDSLQREDVRILKEELGCNIVRTSHYPQSHSFFEECDRRGLLVFTEIPGWQHLGNEEWKKVCIENVKDMIVQYKNHPSIILWGVRVNESLDDDELYAKTNKTAHELDPYRQTSGVRYLTGSNLLEDVYGHNDFSFAGDFSKEGLKTKKKAVEKKESLAKGYLVTENNGHMFPTKAFDDYDHRLEHALRHAQVLDSMYKQEDISGSIGWCMFDYNTHKDFGSGDRICYHGVMDFFRNPKIAASVYASQSEDNDVMEVASCMELGEYPGGNIGDTYIFTNADSVKVYKNDEFVKVFFPGGRFTDLPHPPIIVDDLIGELISKHEDYSEKLCASIKECLLATSKYGMDNLPLRYKLKLAKMMFVDKLTMNDATRLYGTYVAGWGGASIVYRFDGIKNGKVFKSVTRKPASRLELGYSISSSELIEGKSYDVAAVRMSVLDENGNTAVYSNEIIELSCSGSIEIIGPELLSFQGGSGGTYVRTTGRTGKGVLHVGNVRLGYKDIEFNVKKEKQ
ncbi:MAG: glycoside hydrolase family 2 protein, partial [Erysipelotrichaceae bacterium]|nr:glycoside hydrolase family 2 protein [Erysipelotrichaceae bacterium]